jgi:hypothetical protein
MTQLSSSASFRSISVEYMSKAVTLIILRLSLTAFPGSTSADGATGEQDEHSDQSLNTCDEIGRVG